MIKYIFQQLIIGFTIVAVFSTSSTAVFCQGKVQKRIIIENEQNYSIEEDLTSKYLVIKEGRDNNESSFFYSPANNFKLLYNNPIPWYKRNEMFYYVSFDSAFKGNYSLRIQAVDVNKLRSITNYNLKAIMESESTPNNKFFLSEMHNRRFSEDELENLYFDFTVTQNETLVLVSYYQNTICAYRSIQNWSKLAFCGCSELTVTPPVQLFEDKNVINIRDGLGQLIRIEFDQNEILLYEKDNTKINTNVSDEYLVIKNF